MNEPAGRDDHRLDRADLVLGAVLLIAAGVIFAKDISVGGVRWKDESTHIMDGVLLLDWAAAGPDALGGIRSNSHRSNTPDSPTSAWSASIRRDSP